MTLAPIAAEEIDELIARAREIGYSDHARSRTLAEEALLAAREASYAIGEGRALQVIALNAYQMGDEDEAKFRDSVRILEQAEDWTECARSMIYLAYSAGRRGLFEEALSMLERVIVIAQQHKLVEIEALALTHTGYIHNRRKQLPKALVAFQRSLTLIESIGADSRLPLQGLGSVYRELKDYDQAVAYYERTLIGETMIRPEARSISLANIGLILEEAGRPREALEKLYSALAIAEELSDFRNSFQMLTAIPRIHLLLNEVEYARKALDKLFLLVDDKLEDIFACAAYHTRADYNQHIGEWQRAIDDLDVALKFATRASNIEQLKTIYDALSDCYKALGNFERALDYKDKYATIVLESMTNQLRDRISEMEAKHKQEDILRQNEIFRLKNIDLNKANMALTDINKQKDKFISVLRHDLRNPIAAIIGYSNLLTLGEKGMPIEKVAHVIEESGKRMLRLMDDVTHSAKWGELIIEREIVNISRLLQDISDIVRPLAESKDLKLEFKDETGGKVFSVDPNKLYQALTNLIFNAIKFTGNGKRIDLEAGFTSAGALRFQLRDEGIGMPKNFIPRLFDGSADTQRQGTAGESGTGMGLTIAKNVVELHGGTLLIKSEDGKGTHIAIVIPPIVSGKE